MASSWVTSIQRIARISNVYWLPAFIAMKIAFVDLGLCKCGAGWTIRARDYRDCTFVVLELHLIVKHMILKTTQALRANEQEW